MGDEELNKNRGQPVKSPSRENDVKDFSLNENKLKYNGMREKAAENTQWAFHIYKLCWGCTSRQKRSKTCIGRNSCGY